ncbi:MULTISPECIES: MarR family winged helix-turn-helix transcriptional regulator [Rheinheimera]|uniref:MarR family winged helix-turn-helix transcriptional regulator n=1 Tax=Rheinheimera marina TaxID=1774958 RepID=A0ABV9JMD1_9GAMM
MNDLSTHSCLDGLQHRPEWRDSVGLLIAELGRLFRVSFAEELGQGSLTFAQAKALIGVARMEGARQVDLAQRAELQPMTMARLIDELVQLQLVERRPCTQDRRAYRIYLLPAAEAELLNIRQCGERIQQKALQGLDKTQVLPLLHLMRQNMLETGNDADSSAQDNAV